MKVDVRLSKETIAWLRSIEKASGVPLDHVVAVVLVMGKQLFLSQGVKGERPGQEASSRRGR